MQAISIKVALLAPLFALGCSDDGGVGQLSGGEGADAGSSDTGSFSDSGAGPGPDLGPGGEDLGDIDRGEGVTRLCNANCDVAACVSPQAERVCRENCDRPTPGVDPDAPGCAEAAEGLAMCIESLDCDELAPGICQAEQERFVSTCVDGPSTGETTPELESFCESSCDLTARCIFPVPNCQAACISGSGGASDSLVCARALEAAAACLDRTECSELQGGEPPCVLQIGLVQFACGQ